MKLSPYTIASNCTDIYDCNTGLDELYEAYDHYKKTGKKEPAYIWSRVEKLEAKRDKCSLKEHGMKYNDYLLSLDLGITEDISQGIDEELISMKERIADWSSEEAINKAKGKTREQIFEMFGIELFPIAYIPRFFAKLLDDKLENFYVYCSKGYFIDHIVNHHPNIDAKKYLLIQDILNEPDEIKETLVNNRQSYVFIKKIDRFSAVVVGIEITDDNRMILHKSFFDQKKKPYANVGKRLYIFTSEGGDLPHLQGCSSIIRTSKKAHGRSLPALDVSNAKIINNSHNTNNYKENLQGVSKTFPFAKHIAQLYEKGEKLDWKKAQKIAKDFDIETDTEIMQACELGCVLEARRIAQNGNSLAQQYEEMKDLYDRQVNIKPLDTKSKVLNQYSTPCPIAYLLGTFVNQNSKMNDGKILEPSAGNGLLTTVFNPEDVCVNELDEIRVENLRKLGFYNVANIDASEKTLLDNEYQDKSFRGIITNPPFAKLPSDKKIQRNGWEINTLDYKMAVLALDKMHDDGRASIIVGGKMWNAYWKPLSETSQKQVLFGQWKTFLGYLYAQYNVVDVIYVDGDNIYRKQGTQYPIAIILIDGRHKYDESNKPRYVFDPDKDVIIQTYDQLFDRIKQCSSVDEAKPGREETFTYKPQNYRTIKEFKEKYPFGTLVDSVLYNNKIVGEYSFDIENNEIFKESYSIPLDILFREKQGREATERELIYFGKKYAKMGFYVDKSIFFGTKKDEFEKFIKSEFSIVKTSDEEAKRKRAKALLLLAQAKIKIAKAKIEIEQTLEGIDEDFADKLNEFIIRGYKLTDRTDYFSCGYPQEVLQLCDLDANTEIVITQSGMQKILGVKKGKQDEAHDLTPIEILRLPQLLREPILVINGNTSDSRLIFIEIPRAGRKVFAVINVDSDMILKRKRNFYNLVASTYSQENFKISTKINQACATNSVWYYDSRKIKNWLSSMGELRLFPLLEANSLSNEKDVEPKANIQ